MGARQYRSGLHGDGVLYVQLTERDFAVSNFPPNLKITVDSGYQNVLLKERRKDDFEKVTKADVLRVARKHLHPDKLQILAVGRPDDFDEPLSVLGPVSEIDITIPPPKQ